MGLKWGLIAKRKNQNTRRTFNKMIQRLNSRQNSAMFVKKLATAKNYRLSLY